MANKIKIDKYTAKKAEIDESIKIFKKSQESIDFLSHVDTKDIGSFGLNFETNGETAYVKLGLNNLKQNVIDCMIAQLQEQLLSSEIEVESTLEGMIEEE